MSADAKTPTLNNPFDSSAEIKFTVPGQASYEPGLYEEKLREGFELMQRPFTTAGEVNTQKQHLKNI